MRLDVKVDAYNSLRMLTLPITMNLDISFLNNLFPSGFWKTQRLVHRITLMEQVLEYAPAFTSLIESYTPHIFDSSQASRLSHPMILRRLQLLMPLNAIACPLH